jgi:bacterioferritin
MLELGPGHNFTGGDSTMRGNDQVIAMLNQALKEELTAINQYIIHSEMCENWGYKKLSSAVKKLSIDEMKHAEALIERILFLDGAPKMTEVLPLTIGPNVKAQLENDLNLETGAVAMYNGAAQKAADAGDNISRELFTKLLRDEEGHADFLETQLSQLKEMGYENYLATQL